MMFYSLLLNKFQMSSGFLEMKAPLQDSFTVSTHKNKEESEESSPTQTIYVYNQESTRLIYIYSETITEIFSNALTNHGENFMKL